MQQGTATIFLKCITAQLRDCLLVPLPFYTQLGRTSPITLVFLILPGQLEPCFTLDYIVFLVYFNAI